MPRLWKIGIAVLAVLAFAAAAHVPCAAPQCSGIAARRPHRRAGAPRHCAADIHAHRHPREGAAFLVIPYPPRTLSNRPPWN